MFGKSVAITEQAMLSREKLNLGNAGVVESAQKREESDSSPPPPPYAYWLRDPRPVLTRKLRAKESEVMAQKCQNL